MVGIDTSTSTYQIKTEPEKSVLKTDNEHLKILLTIYNLGIIEGCRSE